MATPNNTREQFLAGAIDLTSATVRIALADDSTAYTFDPDTHATVADVLDGGTTATEMSGTGYSRQTLSNTAVTQDDTNDVGKFDADDVTFSELDAGTIQAILIYEQVGGDDTTPGDDRLLAVYDDDSAGSLADLPLTTNGSDVVFQFDAAGILTI